MSAPEVRLPGPLRTLAVRIASRLGTPDLIDDLDEIFQRRVAEDGRRRATLWYAGQVMRGLPPAALSIWQPVARALLLPLFVAGDAGRALRRLARAPSLAISFVCIVGFGMAAVGFMAQVRTNVLQPDLGVSAQTRRILWTDPTGREHMTLPASGSEPWIRQPPGGIGGIVPVGGASLPFKTPQGTFRTLVQTLPARGLTTVGVRPLLGRDLLQPGDVVLSYPFWQDHWGGVPDVIGSVVQLREGAPAALVVGVAPRNFYGLTCCVRPQAWMMPSAIGAGGPAAPVSLFATGVHDAPAAAAGLLRAWTRAGLSVRSVRLASPGDIWIGHEGHSMRATLLVLLALSALAFIGTILNGVNLLLADAIDRVRELRIRRAVGAGWERLAAQVALEVGWLAIGSAAAAALASWALMRLAPWALPIMPSFPAEASLGSTSVGAIVASAAAVTLLTAVPAGVAVALLSRGRLVDRSVPAGRPSRWLLALQVALATALASVALLLSATMRAADGDFVGFRSGRTAVLVVSPSGGATHTSADALLAEVALDPGVSGAALTPSLPVYGVPRDTVVFADGRRAPLWVEQSTRDFFNVVGLRLVAGRAPTSADEGALSEDVARRRFGSPSRALGETLEVGGEAVRVVGVAEAATWGSPWGTHGPRPSLYRGWAPKTVAGGILLVRPAPGTSVVRASTVAPSLTAAGLAVAPYGTMQGLLVRSRVLTVFESRLAVLFTAICLLVALAGIHTHFLRWVRRNERELGIRLALGARSARVGSRVLVSASAPIAAGAGLGVALAWVAVHVLSASVGMADAGMGAAAITAAILTGALGFLATALPAVKAARQDPLTLLRTE